MASFSAAPRASAHRPRPVVVSPKEAMASYSVPFQASLRSDPNSAPPLVGTAVITDWRPSSVKGIDVPMATPRRPVAASGTPSR